MSKRCARGDQERERGTAARTGGGSPAAGRAKSSGENRPGKAQCPHGTQTEPPVQQTLAQRGGRYRVEGGRVFRDSRRTARGCIRSLLKRETCVLTKAGKHKHCPWHPKSKQPEHSWMDRWVDKHTVPRTHGRVYYIAMKKEWVLRSAGTRDMWPREEQRPEDQSVGSARPSHINRTESGQTET